MHRSVLAWSVVLPLAVIGCSSSSSNDSGNTATACRPLTVTSADRSPSWSGTVFTIVMENHDLSEIMGNPDAPYINSLAQRYALAAGYHDSYVHPSEPNYLWMVAGENFGILNDNDPGPSNTISSRSHLADQLEGAGVTWRAYEESMSKACDLQSHDTYAVKHNPFAYFDDINGYDGSTFQPTPRCTEHVVDYAQLAADVSAGQLPSYVFVTPNLDHDMHDGTVAQGDAWLASEVPKILALDAFQKGGVLFLLWDEGSSNGDSPPFLAISPNAKPGYVSHTAYDTSSFLLTVEQIFGLDTLPCAANPGAVVPMTDLFSVPLAPAATTSVDAG